MATARVPIQWPSPSSIDQFEDASLYEFPTSGEWRYAGEYNPGYSYYTYSRVLMTGPVVIKLASSYGKEEYEKYVVGETPDDDAIRGNEFLERKVNFWELVDAYPAFKNCPAEYGWLHTHWLLVHRLQYDRLRKNAATAPAIPEARFVFLSKRRFLLSPSVKPALVQQQVEGVTLWEMIDHGAIERAGGRWPDQIFVKDEYQSLLPNLAKQLRPFTSGEVAQHINWHIGNFIYDVQPGRLYYIDIKPSTIFGRWRNEKNLRNIKRDFLEGSS